ncbi:Disease resistance protein RPS5 [Rhynchospora pubera]|uniref:Disease resistance protein RPS5 n=1 Tax=Rhynchospora pubera TaxID=906938 RepID=A0AAV8HA38_9POAL|nr:Disease resistance protein RPS5 [Rhynchospora pubera]
MDCVSQAVAAVIPSIIGPVLKNIAYPFKVADNVKALDDPILKLSAAQTDVKAKVENAERQGLTQADLVGNWLRQVEAVKGEVDDIKRRYQERSRCFGSQSFNCWSNFSISKDAAKKLMVVQKLCEDGRFEDVAIQLRPEVPELLVGSEVVVPQEEANFQEILRKLLSACLLEEVGSEYVKMHDVIRDMALWIARGEDKENDKWVVLDGLDQMRHKNIRWSDVERASLISYELMVPMNGKELPLNPYEYDELISDGSDEWEGVPLIPCDATRLQFVRVRSGYPFTATIDALVQNVSIFPDLAFLELRNCDLYSFPQGISQLVKLEHLNLENNHIKSVPDELKHVRNLRFLSLGYNSISLFPKGVLPELKELMVLDLYNINRGSSEDGEEQYWTWLINELRCLSKLRCLSINLQQPAHFRNLLELSNLPVRTLFLHYKNETNILEIPSSFVGKVQDNLYKLELKVRSVRKLLFGSNYQSRLGNLEFLSILMDELEMIEWPWNVAPEDLLPMLHYLFFECWRILDVTWTLYLPSLRTLKLFRCVHIVQLFEPVGGCGSGAIKPTFPSLIRLELELLPEMEIICNESITFPSLEEITIHKCPKLKKLPFQSRGKLKTIKIESECWEQLEWGDNDLKQDLQGLVRDLWRRR